MQGLGAIDALNLTSHTTGTPIGGAGAQITARQEDFAAVLSRAAHEPGEDPRRDAHDAARQFVAVTLVQPLLKQLRETNDAAPPFAPSSAEKQFQSLMDAETAQRIVGASHFPLVDRVAQDLLKSAGIEPCADGTTGAEPDATHA